MRTEELMVANKGDLSKALEERDMTGRQLAAQIGISGPSLSKARRGRPVRRSTAAAICGGLQIPIASMFTRVPSEKVAA